jgi:hypothetical protein
MKLRTNLKKGGNESCVPNSKPNAGVRVLARCTLTTVVLGVVFGLTLAPRASAQISPTIFATDASSNALVFPPDAYVFGRTYAEWTEEWWEWNLLLPVSINPAYDTIGQNCNLNQSRPVFFLAGSATGATVTRACTVPSGAPLLFPMVNAECSSVEAPPFFGRNDAERLECARTLIDGVPPATVVVTVDGHAVPALRNFRVPSPPFNFMMPAHDNILGLTGVTAGRSESDGYWAMLTPLKPGKHVLHFEAAILVGAGAGFTQNVTYNLTVK